jgi:hypothetical protein
MPGSGHHDRRQPNHALGGKIKDEVLSALKLLFKNAEQHTVSLALEPEFTIYPTDIPAESVGVPITTPEPEVSLDPVRQLSEQPIGLQSGTLLTEVELAEACPCDIAPLLCHEPVYDELEFESHGISFDNLGTPSNRAWPIQPMHTHSQRKIIEKIPSPAMYTNSGGPITTKSRSILDKLAKTAVKSDPRFYALPIRKAAIPPHRFSLTVREQFRKALAEKARTNPANVQLKIVFERMHMALYASIQPDELGHFLCVPKSELLGRNRDSAGSKAILNQHSAAGQATYLVVGIRLDNKEDIRALVPVHTLAIDPSAGGA